LAGAGAACLFAKGQVHAESAPKSDPMEPNGLVLALGAGNSRGAHQAGVVYALLHDRQLRRRAKLDVEPLSLSGSSIGAMNALIAAAEECRGDGEDVPAPEQSLFWKVWQTFDWDTMFPGNQTCDEYRKEHPEIASACTGDAPFDGGDGLLSSNQTRLVSQLVLSELNSRSFRQGCNVPLAISLLGSTALPLDAKESNLGSFEVKTSRRLFTVSVNPGSPSKALSTLWLAPLDVGNTPKGQWWTGLAAELRMLHMPLVRRQDDKLAIPLTSLVDVATAAISQPPYLVTPPLVACDVSCTPVAAAAAGVCPPGENLCAGRYYDAAVFDHSPLPAAILLQPQRARYVLVDPDAVDEARHDADELARLRGSAFVVKAVPELVSSVADYQLQVIARLTSMLPPADRPDVRRIERKAPLAGDNVLGFGGYIDRRFRYHDYYAGIVDGLFWIEKQDCPNCDEAAVARKVAERYRADVLDWRGANVQDTADLRRSDGLTELLLSTIHDRMCAAGDVGPECKALADNLAALKDDVAAKEIRQIRAAAIAARRAEAPHRLSGEAFSEALREANFDPTNRHLTFVNAHSYWVPETLRQVAARSSAIEAAQASGPSSEAAAFGFIEYGASVGAQKFKRGLQLGPATIPDRIWGTGIIPGVEKALVPAVLATDVLGGFRSAWEVLTYRLELDPRLKLFTLGAVLEWMRYRNLPETWVYGPSLSASYEFPNPVISEFGARAWWHEWDSFSRRGLAAELFLRPLWGRAEIAVGTTQFLCDGDCRSEGLFVTVGIADFNGLLYWALRGATGNDDAYKKVVSEVENQVPNLP
jgi:hypothetical protein